METSSRKGLLVSYSETLKAYIAYILERWKTIASGDVKFEEEFAYRKVHEFIPMIEDEEQEAPKVEPGSPKTLIVFNLGP